MTTRTMYMHLLDGRPAIFVEFRDGTAWLANAGRRNKVPLCVTRAELNKQQRACMYSDKTRGESSGEYSHVLVKVPA
jgi:hypothetical protein